MIRMKQMMMRNKEIIWNKGEKVKKYRRVMERSGRRRKRRIRRRRRGREGERTIGG